MDAFDIFRKLTAGAQFTKKKKHQSSAQKQNLIKLPKNKKETENDNELDINNQFNSQKDDEFNSDIDIKQESEEEEEDYNVHDDGDKEKSSFQILSEKTLEDLPKKRKRSKSDNGSQPKKKMNKEAEEINQLRNSHRIKVYGKNVPAPIQTFYELHSNYNVSIKIIDNLAKCGFPLPTPIQMQALPIMLQGKSLMACAPTGSGKTVAFLAPIIRDLNGPQKNGFRAIILCPTRELAKQIQRECLRLTENIGLKVHILSKMKQAEQMYGPKSNKKYDILISTPKRVCYLLNQEPPLLDLKNIEWFIIDEADKLMEDGVNSFKDQLEQILDACTKPSKKIALFSATYTVPVAKWAIKNLKGLIRVTIGEQNSATDTVKQELLFVGSESGKLLAFRDLMKNGVQPPVLVFVQTKDRAKQLFQELIYDGINVDVIHADRTQQQRDNVVKAFREGKIWILICTELMGRGIDFKGVNLVINYDFPPTVISYIHRIGRTGRAGRPGRAITYFTQDDRVNLRSVAQIIKNSGGNVPDFMLKLKKPKKSDRKMLAKKPLDREDISTKLKFDMKSNKKRKEKDQFQNQNGKFVKVKTSPSEDMKIENLKKKKKINFVKMNKK